MSRAYSGKTMRVIKSEYTEYFDTHPSELQRFPDQMGRAFADGVMHLGADETNTEVDPARECFPAGQGVGGIAELVPAGALVRRFVAEARGRPRPPGDRLIGTRTEGSPSGDRPRGGPCPRPEGSPSARGLTPPATVRAPRRRPGPGRAP